MAIARITTQDATGAGTTNATATYPSVPTKGNLLLAATYSNDGGATLSDMGGWLAAGSASNIAATVTLYYKIAKASEPTVITTDTDVSAGLTLIALYEYNGFSGVALLDKTAGASNNSSTSIGCGTTATTSVANELLFAVAEVGAADTVSSWSGGFTARSLVGSSSVMMTADQVVAATAAYTTTATVTPTAAFGEGCISTFYGDTRFTVLSRGLRPHPFSPGLAR